MKISLDLKNCYGIKSLNCTLNFNNGPTIILYAPNGSMKTSLAKAFQDKSQSQPSRDARYPNRISECTIKDENGNDINLNILVVKPYDDTYHSERVSTLVVNEELRKKYETARKSIEKAKQELLLNIGETAKTKRNTEELFLLAFNDSSIDSSSLLSRLGDKIDTANYNFSDIAYTEINDDRITNFLKNTDVNLLLNDYLDKYEEIIAKSSYFRKDGFNPYNASEVSKNLNNNRFFAAKHSLVLNDNSNNPIVVKTKSDFDKVITEERERVLNDPELKQKFSLIEVELNRNIELRHFYEYILRNKHIIPELVDIETFKQKLWISYIIHHKENYEEFLSVFKNNKQQIEQISNTARQQSTVWKEVIDLFNKRFKVPFKITITNQVDVILNSMEPKFNFEFCEGQDSCTMSEESVSDNLSTGEQRALYLLNIIYEIKALEKELNQSILILDDIADSFDYKNKFAIIEYLKDISESGEFFILNMTHNFDFFRTVQSRLGIDRNFNCLMSVKTDTGVELKRAEYLHPFETWKNQLNTNKRMLIASIPMTRNLIEYTEGQNNANYDKLTSLLHQKPDTSSITLQELAVIYNTVYNGFNLTLGSETVLPLILNEADDCLNDVESLNLENKVVLSIAIRLIAEEIMIKRINDPGSVSSITGVQTAILFDIFKRNFTSDVNAISILDRVVMMTPEPIHLNSFMYEPLIDMSDIELKELYKEIKILHSET